MSCMEGAVSWLCCRSGLATSCNLKAAMTQSSLSTALSVKECQRCRFNGKGGKESKYTFTSIKHFTPEASSSYIAAGTSFTSRAISELGQSNTMQGKYPSWGIV